MQERLDAFARQFLGEGDDLALCLAHHRVDVEHAAVGRKRCLLVSGRLENAGHAAQGAEMARFQTQRPLDVAHRLGVIVHHEVDRGTTVPALGEIRLEDDDLIEEIAELADVARKQGPLGLEGVEVDHEFLAKGVQYIADGYDHTFIRESLERERDLMLERLEDGQRIFKAIGDAAPAFGMIGTLVGLVAMLANMDDPSKIGPSMAIALLTTLYGAVIANLVCLPIADKLGLKSKIEDINLTLILDGVMQLRDSKSPNLVREMLTSYLPEKSRPALAEAAA